MWIRIRAVIIEDEPLTAAQYLATLLDDTCQVEVVGIAGRSIERGGPLTKDSPMPANLNRALPDSSDTVSIGQKRCKQQTQQHKRE